MLVYLATKADFRTDILSNRIEEKILDAFQGVLGKSVGESELASWRNSLPYMDRVLDDPDILHDTGVAIEFNIHLRPCAYLHNCESGSVIHAPFYAEHTKAAQALRVHILFPPQHSN